MADPVTGNSILALGPSDHHPNKTDFKTPNFSRDNNLILAQLGETSHSPPHVPIAPSRGNRRKLTKPTRFVVSRTDVNNKQPPPKLDIVLSDPSSPCLRLSDPSSSCLRLSDPSSSCLSLLKEKSPNKCFKAPLPSSPAKSRAEEVQSSLGTEFPSCIKEMVPSQVSCGFWMGLPLNFCKAFLPKEDVTFVLEDENGEQTEVKYIAYKFGLSAGWKHFAVRHNLIEGDCLVFHLVETTKFKIYILRANDLNKLNGAHGPMNLDSHTEQMTPVTPSPKTKKNKRAESLPLTMVQKKHKKSTPSSRSVTPCQIFESGNSSEEVGSESLELEVSRLSKPVLSFQDVKSFEDFHIVVKGLCIDHELPDDVRMGYYKLCFYKKQFLHDGVSASLYYKLVAGMIGEIVTIANELKTCKLTTNKEEFETWDNSLKSFELLGMNVGFLRDKIHALAILVFEAEGVSDIKRYVEAKNEHKQIKDEIKKVSAKLKELKENAKKIEGISSHLKQKTEEYELKFKEEVAAQAPW